MNISNNQVTNFGQGGIRYEGSGSLQPLGSVPFGRIVNNTVYGGATATGVGIGVFNQAGPTIMNNIVANTVTGIQVDAGSAANTVVDATVFQRNTTNLAGITATNTIALTTAQPLFVAPATGNFYLALKQSRDRQFAKLAVGTGVDRGGQVALGDSRFSDHRPGQ